MKLSVWAWLLLSLSVYLALEFGVFQIIEWYTAKTTAELVGPYLAFAVPWAFFAPLVWLLRMREEHGTSPKRLALGWVLSSGLFFAAVIAATFYSGIELRLMDPKDALGSFVALLLLGIPILHFGMYRRTLKVISMRPARKTDSASFK